MTKAQLLFIILILISITANSQVLLTENFDYPAGDPVASHGWNIHSGTTTNEILVTSPGLIYTGYLSSGIGNAASLTASGQDINKPFDSTNAGVLYASCLVKVTTAAATGDYFFHFSTGTTSNIFMGRVFVKTAANGNLSFGLSKSSTSATILPVYSDSVYTAGTTYLLVMKYSFSAGANDDTASLYINPSLGSEPQFPALTHVTASANDPSYLGTICIRQGANTPVLTIDGIRIGTSWLQVVPVEFTSFSAFVVKDNVRLDWVTATETNNHGFEIERKSQSESWMTIGFVKGNGTTVQSKSYSFTDKNLPKRKYDYRLKQKDLDGSYSYSKTVEVNVVSDMNFELSQNYPNPFNPSTTISYAVPEAGNVTLKIYNMLGQEVRTMVDGYRDAGTYTVEFNGDGLMSGIYLYRLEAGNYSSVQKMTFLK